jgi:hypothetical protein
MLFFAPPPVSYGRQVAPILALYCNVCHGDAGGLSTRTHAGVLEGGNLGKVIVPGDPERSLLLHFVDGRRGESHRMPLGARPLTGEQIETIRRWISEGAKDDGVTLPVKRLRLPRTPIEPDRVARIAFRPKAPAYLTLTIRDPDDGRILLAEAASVKTPKEHYDAAAPGDPIHWNVRAAPGWPRRVDIELAIEYSAADPDEADLSVASLPLP